MKVGTISLNINTHDLNYGAVLHSWAFQKFLLRNGVDTEIIDYTTPLYEKMNFKYPFFHYLKNKGIVFAGISMVRIPSHRIRYQKFKNFIHKEMIVSKKHYTKDTLRNEKLDYDILVCESDVIWSADFFNGDFDDTFFLALPSMTLIKKVAYAASMANAELNEMQLARLKELITNFEAISCRETYAAELVTKLWSKEADCVLDPVLILSEKDYHSIIAQRIIKEPYVLLYIPVGYDLQLIKKAKRYAKRRGLKLVEISSYPWDRISHKTITKAGIEEFLSLIKNAEVVLSNSFHAVCFSVIFHKEFFAFTRRTGKKIKDICERLGLSERFIENEIVDVPLIQYEKVDALLENEKKKSIEFIERHIIKGDL